MNEKAHAFFDLDSCEVFAIKKLYHWNRQKQQ